MVTPVEPYPDELYAFLAAMAQKYFPAGCCAEIELAERIAARVMTAGTYRDVCELVDLAGRNYLREVFTTSPRHWFSAPAREYWARHLDVARGVARGRAPATLAPPTTGHAYDRNVGARALKH
jgi:hypothetical protein